MVFGEYLARVNDDVRRTGALPLVLVDDVWLLDRNMLNHFSTNGARTANHFEGWHKKMNRQTKKAHSNIFSSFL